MSTKRDYVFGFFAGLIAGVALIPVLINLGHSSPAVLIAAVVLLPVCALIGVWLGRFFSQLIPIATQIVKFIIVGVANTALDFGILNLMSIATGIHSGVQAGEINVLGFSVAVVHSYLWNKHWVFKKEPAAQTPAEPAPNAAKNFLTFLVVSIIGLAINSGIIILITTYVPPISGISASAQLDVAKALATCVSLVWNFLGFKFIVFK